MSSALFLELLESRIAPAVVINVGHPPVDDPTLVTFISPGTPFQVADSHSSDAAIATLFSSDTPDHYYLALNSGDKVKLYNSSGSFEDYITVTGGKAIAFFYDSNSDGFVDSTDLTGLSVAASTGLNIVGNVDGDIIGNLDGKTGQMSLDTLLNDSISISKLNIQGSLLSNNLIHANGSSVTQA